MLKRIVEVFPCGTKVKMCLSGADGIVVGIALHDELVEYQIVYGDNNSLQKNWFSAHEFELLSTEKTLVGFKENA